MNFLQQRIVNEGVVKPGHVLKVDSFLNHQMDIALIDEIGKEFHARYADAPITKVLTIESSGIAIAILFFAESIAGSTGLGYFIMESWGMVAYPRMFAGIIALALLGVVVYLVFDILERRATAWRNVR